MQDSSRLRSDWRFAAATLASAAIVIGMGYTQAFADAARVWSESDTYQIAYVVLAMIVYLVWTRRIALADVRPRPCFAAFVLVIPASLLWLIADVANASVGTQFGVVALVHVCVLAAAGLQVYRLLAFPLWLLWLVVPFGDLLLYPLMKVTTVLTVAGVGMAGMSVLAEGNLVFAEGARYIVVEECAAFDFILGNLIVCLLIAHLLFSNTAKRVIFVLSSVPVAILANGVRTTGVVVITHYSGGDIDLASDHGTFGWLVFLAFVVVEIAIGWRLRDPLAQVSGPVPGSPIRSRRWILALIVFPPMLAVAPVWAALVTQVSPARSEAICFPPFGHAVEVESAAWQGIFPTADAQYLGQAPTIHGPAQFHIAFYSELVKSREMVGWGNRLFDPRHWRGLAFDRSTVTVGSEDIVVNRTLLGNHDERRTVWHWYWIDGRFVADPVAVKLLRAKVTLIGGRTSGAIVAISAQGAERDQALAETARRVDARDVLEGTALGADCDPGG